MKPKGIIVYDSVTGVISYHAEDLSDLLDTVGGGWCPHRDDILISIESLYTEKPPTA